MKKSRKIVSILFTLVAIIVLLPTTVLATEKTEDEISAEQTLDKLVFKSDENITATLTVKNTNENGSDVLNVELYNEIPEGYTAKASDTKLIVPVLKAGETVSLKTEFTKTNNPETPVTGDANQKGILLACGIAILCLALIVVVCLKKKKHKNMTTFLTCLLVIGAATLVFSGNAFAKDSNKGKISLSTNVQVEKNTVAINSCVTYGERTNTVVKITNMFDSSVTYYDTLSKALDNASNSDIVQLLADISDSTDAITIPSGVILDLNHHILKTTGKVINDGLISLYEENADIINYLLYNVPGMYGAGEELKLPNTKAPDYIIPKSAVVSAESGKSPDYQELGFALTYDDESLVWNVDVPAGMQLCVVPELTLGGDILGAKSSDIKPTTVTATYFNLSDNITIGNNEPEDGEATLFVQSIYDEEDPTYDTIGKFIDNGNKITLNKTGKLVISSDIDFDESVLISGAEGYNVTSVESLEEKTVTYFLQESACVAAGTLITMENGDQKVVEELEVGDVIRTFDHETGEVSSAPVFLIWESKNVKNAFTLTFEDGTKVTVIEEHGFYDKEEKKYAFINAQNAKDYIGHYFYNVDKDEWLRLINFEKFSDGIDAYSIITKKHLNHLSNGMLSMSDGTVEVLANVFEYDNQMKFDVSKKKSDIETYGLTPIEKILKLEGFYETDYYAYNLQYIDIAIGKGLTSWEFMKEFGEYCAANGI